MATSLQFRVWVTARRYDTVDAGAEEEQTISPQPLDLMRNQTPQQLHQKLKEMLKINSLDTVIKLRNSAGTLIPLNDKLPENTQDESYILEVVRTHQNISTLPRSALPPSYIMTIRNRLKGLEQRVSTVESLVPDLSSRRSARIQSELEQLDAKLVFLNQILADAEVLAWKNKAKNTPSETPTSPTVS